MLRAPTALAHIPIAAVPCIVALLSGCASPEPQPAPIGEAPPAPLLIAAGGCDASEPTWIAVKTDPAPCPVVVGWAETTLFPGSSGPLARFCHYSGGAPQDLLAEPRLVDAAPDCGVVSPQGLLEDTSGPVWALGHSARLDLPPTHTGTATIAVLDTEGVGGSRSDHGPAMKALAAQASAGGSVTSRVALPRVGDGTIDWSQGGHYGSPGELAQAIVDALPIGNPLIINLSLGWVPIAPLDDDDMPVSHLSLLTKDASGVGGPVRAVHAALVEAACQGALIMVSAGNDPIGGGESDALLPAAWSDLEAPTAGDCTLAGIDGPGSSRNGQGLVEAVGGVDLADGPLSNERTSSRPRLVAPAESAAVDLGSRWVIFSGTSAATAAASGAAAAVWNRNPSQTAGEVADTMHAGGVDLSPILGTAVQCGPDTCDTVHRLSVCGAVAQVDPSVACAPSMAFDGGTLQSVLNGLPAGTGAVTPAVMGETDGCNGSTGTCPVTMRTPPSVPWPAVAPQPEWPICPSCTLELSTGTLILEIASNSPNLGDAVLSVYTDTLTKHYPIGDTLGTLVAGQKVKMPGLSLPTGVKSAWLTAIVQGTNGPLSTGNPITLK